MNLLRSAVQLRVSGNVRGYLGTGKGEERMSVKKLCINGCFYTRDE